MTLCGEGGRDILRRRDKAKQASILTTQKKIKSIETEWRLHHEYTWHGRKAMTLDCCFPQTAPMLLKWRFSLSSKLVIPGLGQFMPHSLEACSNSVPFWHLLAHHLTHITYRGRNVGSILAFPLGNTQRGTQTADQFCGCEMERKPRYLQRPWSLVYLSHSLRRGVKPGTNDARPSYGTKLS